MGQLDTNLRRFYAEARNKSGEQYSKSTLLGFRHSFERYLNAPPFNRSLKLSSDPRFKRSNEMLNAQIISLKRQGKENVNHKPAIEHEDLTKLKTSQAIALTNPFSLLRNVWFHVVLFFCRRGREGQRQLKKSSFRFEADASGRRFITMAHDEATKNHPGGVSDVPSNEKLARMYETSEENDGYKAMKFYIARLNPKNDAFFNIRRSSGSTMMKFGTMQNQSVSTSISEAAKLSKVYTNHSVRATAITLWSNAGIQNRHIMAISGHRSEQSLAHYNTRPSTSQLQRCSEVLSRSLTAESPVSSGTAINTHSQIQEQIEMTAATTSSSYVGSLFNNCTVQQAHVHVTFGSDFSQRS